MSVIISAYFLGCQQYCFSCFISTNFLLVEHCIIVEVSTLSNTFSRFFTKSCLSNILFFILLYLQGLNSHENETLLLINTLKEAVLNIQG